MARQVGPAAILGSIGRSRKKGGKKRNGGEAGCLRAGREIETEMKARCRRSTPSTRSLLSVTFCSNLLAEIESDHVRENVN